MSSRLISDEDILCQLFTDNARTQILSLFLDNPGTEYNITQISQETNLTRATIYSNYEPLLNLGVVESASEKKYRLNQDNIITRMLLIIHSYDELQL